MKSEEISIAEAINLAMSKYHGGDIFRENVVLDAWKRVLPSSAHPFIRRVFLENKILKVYLSSPILKHSLFINREVLLKKLNSIQDKVVVEAIVFI